MDRDYPDYGVDVSSRLRSGRRAFRRWCSSPAMDPVRPTVLGRRRSGRPRSGRRRPRPMQRFVTRGRLYQPGIGTTGRVVYGDEQIGPAGAIAQRRSWKRKEAEHGNHHGMRSASMIRRSPAGREASRGVGPSGDAVHLHVREFLPSVRRRADREAQPRSLAGMLDATLQDKAETADSTPSMTSSSDFYQAADSRPGQVESLPEGDRCRRARAVRQLQLGTVLPYPADRRRASEQEPALRGGPALVPLYLRPDLQRPECRAAQRFWKFLAFRQDNRPEADRRAARAAQQAGRRS